MANQPPNGAAYGVAPASGTPATIYFYPAPTNSTPTTSATTGATTATVTSSSTSSSIAFGTAGAIGSVAHPSSSSPPGVISFAAAPHTQASPARTTGATVMGQGQSGSQGGGVAVQSSYNNNSASIMPFTPSPPSNRPPPIPPRPSSAIAHAAVTASPASSSSSGASSIAQPSPPSYQQSSPAAAPRSTLAGAGAHIGGTSSPATAAAAATGANTNNSPAVERLAGVATDDPNLIFERLRVLRTTLFGQLWLAKYKSTGQLCAIKRSEKERMLNTRSREDPRAECRMLRIVRGHRNVVNLLGEYECAKYHWIVYELVEGGDFFGLVERNGKLSDLTARVYFKQMVQGVLFMHKAGLAHLDLKPENLLITRDHTDIKICDFGMSRELKEARPLASAPTSPIRYFQGPTGTKLYMAPEVFAGRPFVPALADCYSLGVVLYVMLTGAPPYELPAESDLRFQYIFNGRLVELLKHFKYFDAMHPDAVDLLSKMLCTYLSRVSLEQVLQHPWLAGVDTEMKRAPTLAVANIGAVATTITPSSATPGTAAVTSAAAPSPAPSATPGGTATR